MSFLGGIDLNSAYGTVLVTGHTGFKGTWLTLLLEHFGVSVVGYSLKPTKNSLYSLLKRSDKIHETFSEIHQKIHNTPYDLRLKDWRDAWVDLDIPLTVIEGEKDTNQFWCSALVSYVLSQLGIIDKNLPFNVIAPRDFSELEKGRIKFNCVVDKEFLLY